MTDALVADLKEQIAKRQVVAIVGAGVSIGATNRQPVASWEGLLRHGVERCRSLGRADDGWVRRRLEDIDDGVKEGGDIDSLLGVAELITRKLDGPAGGEWRIWLRETVGALRAERREVIEALRDLGVILATTNYDGLLEDVTELEPVTWRDGAEVQRVLRGDEPGVVHLHGFWRQPESVVLGIRSYEAVLGDAHAQAIQSALATMRTFLFVGCGAGLADPNFGALRAWIRQRFAGSDYRHFRLVRAGEREAVQKEHPPEERVFAVSYGEEHDDLAPFLWGLATTRPAPPKPAAPPAPGRLPPRPRCYGRDAIIQDIVASLLADEPPPIPVLGGPGIGKSTVCLAALHEPRVAARFGARRYFVRCDGAETAEALLGGVAQELGVPLGPELGGAALAELGREPAALVLDNAETPWEAEPLPTEEVLRALAGVPGVALIAAVRGGRRPFGPSWRETVHVPPLVLPDARKVFLAIAGEKHANDPRLGDLLAALEGVPLAVELMAHVAETEPDLEWVWRRWQEERVAMFRRADGKAPLTNAEVSFELSIGGPRMSDEGRRLLSLLGLLPDGVAHGDLDALAPGFGRRGAAVLREVGLAFDADGRLRVLAPVRKHVAQRHPPPADDVARAAAHYARLTSDLAPKAGTEGGADAIARLAAEAANITTVLVWDLEGNRTVASIRAGSAFAEFVRLSGLGTSAVTEAALNAARAIGDAALEAECIFRLGNIALARSEHGAARGRFEEALGLYRQVGDVQGEANCILCLGVITLARSEHEAARRRFEEALPLCRRVGDVQGEANCIFCLGDIALRRSEHEDAEGRIEKALPLYRRVGDMRGAANCIQYLGRIALARSEYGTAQERLEEALQLYRWIGEVLGEAECIQRFGDIALARADPNGAQAHYQEALPLYHRVGEVFGEAECIGGLGDIVLARSEPDEARRQYEEALGRYARIPESYSIGMMHRRLARLAPDAGDRRRHVEAARGAWRRIGRDDLVRELDEEFGKEG